MSAVSLPVSLPASTHLDSTFKMLEARLLQAFQARNIAEISELIDDRCMGIGIQGKEYSKADFLADLYASVEVKSYEVISVKVIEEDNFAIILANWEVDMKLDQSMIRGRMRVTRTWVRRSNGWKMISFHLTDARLASAWENLKRT